ncbi:MAG: putative rane protein [Rickettsiaceae bacterium]|jgi:hypothetical protein|nr:putative rane protein [Rickettsiaceae bacterium]
MPEKKTLRVFGLIWAVIFFVIGYKYNMNRFFLGASFCFLLSAAFFPEIYFKTKLFQIWIKFGDFIGKINSKIITFLLFFFIFTPISLVLKLLGKDLLSKEFDKSCTTYFTARQTQPGDMKNQF